MRRPTTLNDLDPLTAAGRIGDYLQPQSSGDWSIEAFTVDADAALTDRLRAFGDGGGRFTPEGSYLKLANADGVMMSNTPDELADHQPFMEAAHGRVLVHGLGLSCVVSGLLANERVTHIDVVELSTDVIAMVGPCFIGEDRVTIHQGDALNYPWPDNARWDFVWHDIWQTINCDNLTDEDAEGVSYEALLRRFAPLATHQAAWGLDMALLMQAAYDLADERAAEWGERWRKATPDERREILIDWHAQASPILSAIGGERSMEQRREGVRWMLSQQEDNPEQYERDEARFIIDAPPLIPEVRDQLPALTAAYYARLGVTPIEEA